MTGRALAADAKLPYLDLALPKPLLGYEWIRGRERVIVTEGPFDWLSALAWGLPACALLGTHPGARPLRLLGRIPSLLLVLDNDTAGVPAAESLSHAIGDRARVLRLPDRIKDLNELARQEDGRERFLELIADAEDGGADVPVVA
jgi:DNA primase